MATKKKESAKAKEAAKTATAPTGGGSAEDFEKLGVFYLGRPYDMAAKQSKPGWLLYDSKDLVTHAVCVGMTGSGKTGLCIGLLEEAAIDGIPALIIDPKGDLANLMLNFPQLRGEDFAPWVNEDDARKKGLSPADYATQQAELWKKGLGDWGQSGERIQKLRDAADVVVYTPGSNAGIPVSILKSFAAPSQEILDDAEMLRERISTTVTSLLGSRRCRGRSNQESRTHSAFDDSRPHMEGRTGSGSGHIDPADPDSASCQDRRVGSGFVLSLEGTLCPRHAVK